MKLQATTHETAWAPVIDAWLADAVDGGPAAEAALAEAAGACLAAAEKAPCARCDGRFAEQWGDAPWHCFDCKERIDPSRAAPEAAAQAAAIQVDAPFVREKGLSAEGEERHAARGVSVSFLLALLASLPAAVRRTVTTGQLVARLVKPATARLRCRFVELPAMRGRVGKPKAFVSHVWSAPFADLVAAIAHAFGKDDFVWVGPRRSRGNRTAQPRRLSPRPRSLLALARGAPASRRPPLHNPSRTTPRIDRQVDIFAVRQWAGNVADLDFACAIRAAPVFLLVAMHLPEVEALSQKDALAKKVPVSAKSKCAFYRVWVRRTARLAPSPPHPPPASLEPTPQSAVPRGSPGAAS